MPMWDRDIYVYILFIKLFFRDMTLHRKITLVNGKIRFWFISHSHTHISKKLICIIYIIYVEYVEIGLFCGFVD